MTLATRNQNWLPEIFRDFFDNDWMQRASATAPAINVKETEKDYEVEVAAPGLTKDDFSVNVDADGNLVIKMEQKHNDKEEDKKAHYLRREFNYAKYEQTLVLPDDVRKDDIKARVEDGVLHVSLPKQVEEKAKVQRQIEVK